MTDFVHARYRFDTINWKGYACYRNYIIKPVSHYISRGIYEQLGRPKEIIVIVVPVSEEAENASEITSATEMGLRSQGEGLGQASSLQQQRKIAEEGQKEQEA